jgi:transposase
MEGTEGYEHAAASSLLNAGLPVAVINPRHVRDFALAVGTIAKTDPIDSKILAYFAKAIQPPVRRIADQKDKELGQLL